MVENDLKWAWEEMGKLLYIGFHDGLHDPHKEPWEQDDDDLLKVWSRITHPKNCEALRQKLGTGGNPDGERMIQEAYRQAVARSKRN